MKQVDLIQGTPEWHAHRAQHWNASEAPAMMGCSPYETRNELLQRIATGIKPEVDAATQQRYDDGHAFEAKARTLAEAILGEALFPDVGVEGKYSASFDGLTMDESVAFEHKTLNNELRFAFADIGTMAPNYRESLGAGALLPLHYRVQMEHQLMVSGAEKCLFMASKWDRNSGELLEEHHCWYGPNPKLRAEIIAGWKQFEEDLAAFVPPERAAPVLVTPVASLPALMIQVQGSIALVDNLTAFGDALNAYVAKINRTPKTDQDFADLDAVVKTLKKAEEAIETGVANALAQTSPIEAMCKQAAQYRELARTERLHAEKLVKYEKEARKAAIVTAGQRAFESHVTSLNEAIGHPYMPHVAIDFGSAVRGLKSLDSIQNAVDTALAKAKVSANELCADIRRNIATLRAEAKEYAYLFADTAQLVLKQPDDLAAVIKARIATQKEKEAAKAEANRIENERRIAAAVAAEAERVRREERDKAEAEARAKAPEVAPVIKAVEAPQPKPATPIVAAPTAATGISSTRPTGVQIVEVLALHYRVHESKVIEWLISMDFEDIKRDLESEFA